MAHTNNLKRASRTRYPAPPKKKKVSTRQNAHSDYPVTDYDSTTTNDLVPVVEIAVDESNKGEEEDGEGGEKTEDDRTAKAALITEFHALEKALAASKDPLEQRMIKARQEAIGGLAGYQAASIHGGEKIRGGETGKWCVDALIELAAIKAGSKKGKGKGKSAEAVSMSPIRLLDVGAISGTAYDDADFVQATCIDLNSQAPHVIQCDFFDFPIPAPDKLYDVVGLSLVLNFVGSLTKRAEMLRHVHSYLKPKGLLYLVLPLPCIENSRYCDEERLTGILLTCGWSAVKRHDSKRLTFWLLERVGEGKGDDKVWKKEELRSGGQRNNFCIIVKPDTEV